VESRPQLVLSRLLSRSLPGGLHQVGQRWWRGEVREQVAILDLAALADHVDSVVEVLPAANLGIPGRGAAKYRLERGPAKALSECLKATQGTRESLLQLLVLVGEAVIRGGQKLSFSKVLLAQSLRADCNELHLFG